SNRDELHVEPFYADLAELASDKREEMTHRGGRVTECDSLQLSVTQDRRKGGDREKDGGTGAPGGSRVHDDGFSQLGSLLERRCDFIKKASKMFVLIPRGHAQRDVLDAGGKIGLQFLDASLRSEEHT